jgi:hypothetical protein
MLIHLTAYRSLPILALLSMLLWAAHALAGYTDGNGQSAQATYDSHPHSHPHSHDDDLSSQSLQPGGDHQHSSLVADHLHETPHLIAWPQAPRTQAEATAFGYARRLAISPPTRIERPPRT